MAVLRRIFFLLTLIYQHLHVINGQLEDRIVGGTETSISRVPYLVNIRQNGQFFCGGTLIHEQFVLTAAHCMEGKDPSTITVQGGASSLSAAGVRRKAVKIFMPSLYDTDSNHYDVAVIKLESRMTGTNICTIPLCSQSLFLNQAARIAGWGYTIESAGTVPNTVRTAIVNLISAKTCATNYSGLATITSTMMCASADGKDACTGDSGGPLIVNNQVCGIVSFGYGCARTGYPGVYTRVSSVRTFINYCLTQ